MTTTKLQWPVRTISVVVPERARGPEYPQGELGIGFLEALIVEACALAGVDATAPMRRDVVKVRRLRSRRR